MKNFVCSLFLIMFVCSIAPGQNWRPINKLFHYNYVADNNTELISVWVDSSSFNNQTNSYYLNRNLEDSMDVNFCGLCYCKTNQPGFLQHMCVIPPNGNVAFYFPDTFYINIYDSVGASWVYDYYPTTITAQIISATFDSIFDTMDSVKTILLSTNDTIRISKKFGILCFPKGPSPFEYYRLKGIDGAVDQGLQIPKFHEYFDMNIGDIFQYESFYIDGGNNEHYSRTHKYIINGRSVYADSISLQISGVSSFTYLNFPPVSSFSSGTFTIIRDSFPFTEEYTYDTISPHLTSLFPMPFAFPIQNFNDNPLAFFQLYDPSLKIFARTFYDDNGVYSKSFGNYYSTKFAGSIMTDVPGASNLMQNYSAENFSETYKIGLGQTDFVFSFFEHYQETHLTAYSKNGDTVGVFIPGALFAGQNEIASAVLHTFPSPAKDKLFIPNISNGEQKYDVKIYSLSGTVFNPHIIHWGNPAIVDIANLCPGLYFIEINAGAKRMSTKFIKQ